MNDCIDFITKNIPITTPLWLCPIRTAKSLGTVQPFSTHGVCTEDMMVDIGIYGRVSDFKAKEYSRLLDLWVLENQSRKMVS